MNKELKELADKCIEIIEREEHGISEYSKQTIYSLAEMSALRGQVDYQNEQIGAFLK